MILYETWEHKSSVNTVLSNTTNQTSSTYNYLDKAYERAGPKGYLKQPLSENLEYQHILGRSKKKNNKKKTILHALFEKHSSAVLLATQLRTRKKKIQVLRNSFTAHKICSVFTFSHTFCIIFHYQVFLEWKGILEE